MSTRLVFGSVFALVLVLAALPPRQAPPSGHASRHTSRSVYHARRGCAPNQPGSFLLIANREQTGSCVYWTGTFFFAQYYDECVGNEEQTDGPITGYGTDIDSAYQDAYNQAVVNWSPPWWQFCGSEEEVWGYCQQPVSVRAPAPPTSPVLPVTAEVSPGADDAIRYFD